MIESDFGGAALRSESLQQRADLRLDVPVCTHRRRDFLDEQFAKPPPHPVHPLDTPALDSGGPLAYDPEAV